MGFTFASARWCWPALALAVGFVLFLTADRLGGSARQFETYIRKSVQGLEVGSAVRYRGVSIGRISEVGLVSAEYRRPQGDPFGTAFQLVYVRFAVDNSRIGETPNIEDAVKLGLRVRIAAQGITGVNYLELDFVDPERFPPRTVPWEPRYPYVPAIPSTVAQVQSAAEQLLQKLQEADLPALLDNVIGLVADLRGQVKDGDLAVTLREAAELMRTLRSAAASADVPAWWPSCRAPRRMPGSCWPAARSPRRWPIPRRRPPTCGPLPRGCRAA